MTVDATRLQNRASHPESSTWVSANAGSGKTRVLTDRVARLLLAGNDPQQILCLTYTKAAAAEMQNRLFGRLGTWAMMPDGELRDALTQIGERGDYYDDGALARTRTHFARALETPGGLKIQTIHAFCANLLRRFPLEAGVSPQFREMDEGQAGQLRARVLEEMARDDDTTPFDGFARHLTNEDRLDGMLLDVLKRRDEFATFDRERLAISLGIPSDLTVEVALGEALDRIETHLGEALLDHLLNHGNKTEKKAGAALEVMAQAPAPVAFDALEKGFLKKDKQPLAKVLSASAARKQPHFKAALEEITDIIVDGRARILAVRSLDRAQDLHRFGSHFIQLYEAAKSSANQLDFDDLIGKTKQLLSSREMTDWVLYKIDSGIDHILVDEAQDTSPDQWQIIQALCDDFTSGQTASNRKRTIFVVGDKKQSIFGFQGADPQEFLAKEGYFTERFRNINSNLERIALPTSFRSASPILRLVDNVFADDQGALGGPPEHIALEDTPGRVDLWAFEEPEEKPEQPPWWSPVDTMAVTNPIMVLADRVASHIADSINNGTLIHTRSGSRSVQPGDFLVLVRSRSRFFHVLIDKLKSKNIPVAGADRMKIKDQLAVRDLISLLKFLDNELEDLSLAEALRSPIFGITEGELFTLAHDRTSSLWERLQSSDHLRIVQELKELRAISDFVRPYDILCRILIQQGAREKFVARLGAECEDAIDELLAQAVLYEASNAPTLGGFLHWLSSQNVEIKRDMEAGRNEVRVMTVHGAKGLEAPIVILPDVTKFEPSTNKPALARLDGQAVWTAAKDDEPEAFRELEDERKEKERREYARLLYVALTRAENWLIVAGAGQRVNTQERWYNRVERAFEALGVSPDDNGTRSITHLWDGFEKAAPASPTPSHETPDWIAEMPTPFVRPKDTVSPSGFEGPHALPGENEQDGTLRGDAIHKLLELLPQAEPARWDSIGASICPAALDPTDILAETKSVLEKAEFGWIFDPQTLVEVSVSATLPELAERTMSGRIDRLHVSDDRVVAVDFKSNAIVPENPGQIPKAILAQQGAYASALAQIYPDRQIETAILWTRTAQLMTLPHRTVIEALKTATVA